MEVAVGIIHQAVAVVAQTEVVEAAAVTLAQAEVAEAVHPAQADLQVQAHQVHLALVVDEDNNIIRT